MEYEVNQIFGRKETLVLILAKVRKIEDDGFVYLIAERTIGQDTIKYSHIEDGQLLGYENVEKWF